MINHEAGFSALHMTDHVPFYRTLRGEGLDFRNSLFWIVLPKNMDACFNRSLHYLDRLRFCDDNQTNFFWIAIALASSRCNLIECGLVIFADGGNDVGHGVIIILWVGAAKKRRA